MDSSIADLRRNYTLRGLSETDVDANPFKQFQVWFGDAVGFDDAVALAERARELATMRMLGFFRMEVSYILLGELAMLTIAAVPPGCLGGYLLAWKLTEGTSNGMFRLPLFVSKASFGYGILVITLTVLVSGLAVAWRVFRFDLIGILKIRE